MASGKVVTRCDDTLYNGAPSTIEDMLMGKSAKKRAQSVSFSAKELLESKLIGLWADRKDIKDSAKYARSLREDQQNRRR